MSLSRKEPKDIGKASGQPMIIMEKDEEKGLTPEEKKILQDTMRRHDKAFKTLANM